MDFDVAVIISNYSLFFWSGKRDSNSRPRPWQGRALPTELFPHTPLCVFLLVLRVGLEPTRPCGQGILSPSCLPFHHQSFSLERLLVIGYWLWNLRQPLYNLSPITYKLLVGDLSGKRDSNSRPRPWQGRALPTELFPHAFFFNISTSFLPSKAGAKVQPFLKLAKYFLFFCHNFFYLIQFQECFYRRKCIYINI